MVDHPSRHRIHLSHLSQEPGPPLWASLQIEGFVCGVILIATPTLGSLIGTAKGGRVEEDNRACVE